MHTGRKSIAAVAHMRELLRSAALPYHPGCHWPIVAGEALTILACVMQAYDARQQPPSVRELMARTGIKSPTGIMWHLRRLQSLGLITKAGRVSRTLRHLVYFIPASEILGRRD